MRDVFAELVGDHDEFARETWNRRPFLRRGGASDGWEPLMTVNELDRVLASRRSDLHLLKDGAWLDRALYTSEAQPGPMLLRTEVIDTRRLYREFTTGATIVLLGAHEWWAPLDRMCAELARSLTMAVQANVYVAPPGVHGHRHHDLHHIFALQLLGTKRWVVEGTRDEPGATSPGPVAIDAELQPGDCLYVPPRFAHHVETTEAYSTHVTFGVMAPTWSDVIRTITCSRLGPELCAKPLPPGFADEGVGRTLLEREAVGALAATREMADRWTTADLVAETATRFGVIPERTWDGHYTSLVGATRLTSESLAARHPDVRCELTVDHGVLHLALADRTLEMPGWLLPAVTRALSGEVFCVAELHELIDQPSAEVLVRRLVREGVLVLVGHQPDRGVNGIG